MYLQEAQKHGLNTLYSKIDGDKASKTDVIWGIAMEAHSKRLAEHVGKHKGISGRRASIK
jgi:hypothetical protein